MLRTLDFKRAVKSGKRRVSDGFVVIVAEQPSAGTEILDEERSRRPRRSRLGVTVSKRVGNAVVRNRVKRCIREWFRHARAELPYPSDIVVIARRTARGLSGREVATFLDRAIQCPITGGDRQTAVRFQ